MGFEWTLFLSALTFLHPPFVGYKIRNKCEIICKSICAHSPFPQSFWSLYDILFNVKLQNVRDITWSYRPPSLMLTIVSRMVNNLEARSPISFQQVFLVFVLRLIPTVHHSNIGVLTSLLPILERETNTNSFVDWLEEKCKKYPHGVPIVDTMDVSKEVALWGPPQHLLKNVKKACHKETLYKHVIRLVRHDRLRDMSLPERVDHPSNHPHHTQPAPPTDLNCQRNLVPQHCTLWSRKCLEGHS